MVVYNEEKYILQCINSILGQSFNDFELIIVDDCSTDRTQKIIDGFDDKRIVKERNRENYNIAKSRNIGLSLAKGDFIFFIDADCIANKDWLKNGLEYFKDKDSLGVGGFTHYVAEDYKPTSCDKIRGTCYTDKYNTCNIAYRKEALKKVRGFKEERYPTGYEDLDLAFRILRLGKISHSKEMIVYHQKKEYSLCSLFARLDWVKYQVYIIKDHERWPLGWHTFWITARKTIILDFPLLDPTYMGYIIFPPFFLLHTYWYREVKSIKHFFFIFVFYLCLVFGRLIIWKTAIKERVFVI